MSETFERFGHPPDKGEGSLLLLPHYEPHPEGLTTIGGRLVQMGGTDRRLAEFCRVEREWDEIEAAFGSVDALASLRRLVEAGFLMRLPPARPSVPSEGLDLVLSPHIDDAALSLGASIAGRRTRRTLVLNVFSRQSYQSGLRAPRQRLDDLAAAEDALVGRKLGYERRDLGFEGAQDRHGLPLAKIFGWTEEAVSADPALLAEVDLATNALRPFVRNADRPGFRLFAPAAIGGHLDHVIVSMAAIRLLDEGAISPAGLLFYEDLPYAAAGMAGRIGRIGLLPIVEDVTDTITEKLAALAIFRTRLRAPQIALCGRHAASLQPKGGAGERRFIHQGDV